MLLQNRIEISPHKDCTRRLTGRDKFGVIQCRLGVGLTSLALRQVFQRMPGPANTFCRRSQDSVLTGDLWRASNAAIAASFFKI